jgi:predicted lipoprotein with Yx(FWY)xxD motif
VLAAFAAAAVLLVAACSSSGSAGSGSTGSSAATTTRAAAPDTASGAATPAAGAGVTIQTASGPLGTILTDGNGRTVYMWESDSPNTSTCSGQCASIWPPVTTSGTPVAGPGVASGKLGSFARADGSQQVSYNGWPLYYFASDKNPGDTSGQGNNGFGALWWVLDVSGTPVTAASGAPPAGSSPDAGSPSLVSSTVAAPPVASSSAIPSPVSSSAAGVSSSPPPVASSAGAPPVSSPGNGYVGG